MERFQQQKNESVDVGPPKCPIYPHLGHNKSFP